MSPRNETTKSTTKRAATKRRSSVFTDEERAAMKEYVRERKTASRRGTDTTGESDVLEKIAEMKQSDRAIAKRVHAIIKAAAPELAARTWYGMPAYANGDGKIVCHFQPAQKFKTRYATLGFSDKANLDEGAMWPVGFAVTKLTATEEAMITELVKRALS